MQRLWVKLSLAFLLIALAAVGFMAALTARTTGEEFQQYVVQTGMAQPGWASSLEEYYARTGSWSGVETVLAQLGAGAGGAGMGGRGRGAMAGAGAGPNPAVVDTAGRVVTSKSGEAAGEQLPASALALGIPLEVDGRQVGTLLNLRSTNVVLDAQGEAFLLRVRQSLLWTAALAVVLAVALGVLFSRRLAAPLARLTAAAGAIARGDLGQKVAVGGRDEIGQLGTAFNQMADNLAEAETLRRNMVADVAHELRTPLTVIQGNLQAILDGVYPLDVEQVASLYEESRLLTRLVDDLRDLALAEAGQLRLEREPVDLEQLVQAVVVNFGAAAEAAGVKLSLSTASRVPIIQADADRLGQVLRNLLSNALRHTPADGSVTVRLLSEPEWVSLQVADTGSGIGADDLPHVFDRFYRADKSRSRQGGGAGLGLAIVRQLVAAHGGEVSVDSQPGEGATFTVRLPVGPTDRSPAGDAVSSSSPAAEAS
jgi:signal transduction histidine kinase